ncbi:Uncharacterized protein OS=Planctomyces maris DSM 8797 GN=PM8797T_01744 PE=4 SV=1 [Gemmata massiliana]|uniref:Uncharacterized protein n=1 Tax=Gemmata massiliana TaxID=1210884 RepID=A0A6P2CUP5_9BACT|nr:hypothetical protein [Gemmata massiliana]VTR92878.1 Uncharacterized protein OS=Planctomyces maris DSM 8797 GN=PM8797T_01744 PE=4 SV=1 [Gemmata massiliana]
MRTNPFRLAARLFDYRTRNNHSVATLPYRACLRLERMEDRDNPASPVGYLDVVGLGGSQYVAAGWAEDPDVPSQPVQVHIYVDGTFAVAGTANMYRSDLGHNWGFSITIPAQFTSFQQGANHSVAAYAIDANGGTLNPQLTSSPKPVAYGDAAVTGGDVGGLGGVTVGTAGRFAGAVDSITWNGFEFVNTHDDGRLEQTALWGIPAAETSPRDLVRYNPTEAGSETDIGQPTTTSVLTSITKPASNELTTTSQMALWNRAGTLVDNGMAAYNPDQTGQTLPALSNYTMSKDVTVGFGGLNNVIHQPVTINVPAADQLQRIQVQQIVFTTGTLTSMSVYNFATNQLDPLSASPGATLTPAGPVVESTTDGSYAIAIVSRQLSGGALTLSYGVSEGSLDSNGVPYGVIYAQYNSANGNLGPYSGTYSFDNYIVVGTRSSVLASLRSLQLTGWVQTTAGHASLLAAAGNGVVAAQSPGYGVSLYQPSTGWVSLGTGDADAIAVSASGNVVATFSKYGSSNGVYEYVPGAGWQHLWPNPATLVGITGTGAVVANFNGNGPTTRSTSGVYEYTPSTGWAPLGGGTGLASQLAVNANGDVAAAFPGYGVYRYKVSTGWILLTSNANVTQLGIASNGNVVGQFTGYGIERYTDATGWSYLGGGTGDASALAVDANGDVVASFNGYGIFRYKDSTGWVLLTRDVSPAVAIDDNAHVFAEFPNLGIWSYS